MTIFIVVVVSVAITLTRLLVVLMIIVSIVSRRAALVVLTVACMKVIALKACPLKKLSLVPVATLLSRLWAADNDQR